MIRRWVRVAYLRGRHNPKVAYRFTIPYKARIDTPPPDGCLHWLLAKIVASLCSTSGATYYLRNDRWHVPVRQLVFSVGIEIETGVDGIAENAAREWGIKGIGME